MTGAATALFEQIDLAEFPDVHALETDTEQVLWVLIVAKKSTQISALTAAQISEILEKCCHLIVTRQKAKGLLENCAERKLVVRKRSRSRKKSADTYEVMKAGVDLIKSSGLDVVFVDPAMSFSGIRRVEELLESIDGPIKVCDPYVDPKTLVVFSTLSKVTKIELLTETIHNSSKFRRDLTAFNEEFPFPVQVRSAQQGLLHDRFMLHEKGILLFGGSLKGLGKKQTFVVSLGQNFSTMANRFFGTSWSGAKAFK